MNINEIGAKTGHCCECEAPMSMDSRTIKEGIARRKAGHFQWS